MTHERLDPALLLRAYAAGLFPMADSHDAPDIFWVEPKARGILPLDGFHCPQRLARTLRQERFTHHVDRDFAAVMQACAEATTERQDTWINPTILDAYQALHRLGHAHSVECWQDGRLVGGLYGVRIGAAFFGESMFTRVRDASKCALAHLVARLRTGGFVLLDTQFLTDHLARFGAHEISRSAYRARLSAAVSATADFGALDALAGDGDAPSGFGADCAGARPATTVSGPVSGKLIAQLVTQTS